MNETFMKERPVLPLILSMSLPMVISMLVNSLYNIVDSFFVAKISEDAMTALSLVYPVQNSINVLSIGFGVGINAVIAFSFTLIVNLTLAFEKFFQAVGRMKVTMLSMMCGCIANIVLDPVLIFGLGPFPEMGIEGAALATGIGQALTLAIYLVIFFIRPLGLNIRRRYLSLDKSMVLKLYSIGIPATLNLALPSILISALNGILAAYSEVYILVLGIYYKLQTFLYLPANGIVQGMRPLIGYNYGAGEHKRVKQIYKIVLYMSGMIMILGTVICLLIPDLLMGLFTDSETTIQAGQTALRSSRKPWTQKNIPGK